MELVTIAIIAFIIGVFSNPIPLVGGLAFNILITSLLLAYQQLAEAVTTFPVLPVVIFVGAVAYSVGVFTVRFLAYLPIPYVSDLARMISPK